MTAYTDGKIKKQKSLMKQYMYLFDKSREAAVTPQVSARDLGVW